MNQKNLIGIQNKLAQKVVVPKNGEGYSPSPNDIIFTLDIQYVTDWAHIALDVSHYSGKEIAMYLGTYYISEPYVSQFFCFREGPPLISMIRAVENKGLIPDCLLIDGHGLAHPRKFGVACYVGIDLEKPTIGSAKRPLLPYSTAPDFARGSTIDMILDGEKLGEVLRTQDGINPVFVSPGHLISIENAVNTVLHLCGKYRIPDPIRRADQAARIYAKGEMVTGGIDLGELPSV